MVEPVNARRDSEGIRWTAHDEQGEQLWVADGDGGMSGLTRSELESMRGPTREETAGERLLWLADNAIEARRIWDATRSQAAADGWEIALGKFRDEAGPDAVRELAREQWAAGHAKGYSSCRAVLDD